MVAEAMRERRGLPGKGNAPRHDGTVADAESVGLMRRTNASLGGM